MAAAPPLAEVVAILEEHHGATAPHALRDPFELVLWDLCAYLVEDDVRMRVFSALKKLTRLDPKKILATSDKHLLAILEPGGMVPLIRLDRVRKSATLALDIGLSTLRAAVKTDPIAARKLLKRFPGVADPGAERILMFAGAASKSLGPESNGVRVLNRLGFGELTEDWNRNYRTATKAVEPELPNDPAWLVKTHHLLRRHGKALCKHSKPRCPECPLRPRCAHASASPPSMLGAAAWEKMFADRRAAPGARGSDAGRKAATHRAKSAAPKRAPTKSGAKDARATPKGATKTGAQKTGATKTGGGKRR